MELFKPEKDLIWRVVNAVLLIWVLISVVIFINFAIIDNVVKEPINNYSNYKTMNCANQVGVPEEDQKSIVANCKSNYNREQDYRDYNNIKGILGSLVSLGISGGALFMLNRKKHK